MLETLKTNIEINLTNNLMRSCKLPANAPIFFSLKLRSMLRLYVNYQKLNNLIIKNWYLLPLIRKYLDWLSQIKGFE